MKLIDWAAVKQVRYPGHWASLTIICAVVTLATSLAVAFGAPAHSASLKERDFRKGIQSGATFANVPPAIQEVIRKGCQPGLWLDGTRVPQVDSEDELRSNDGVTCRFKADTHIYVNQAVLDRLHEGRRIVIGTEVPPAIAKLPSALSALTLALLMIALVNWPTSRMDAPRASHLPALDGLRGIAAVIVLLMHALPWLTPLPWFYTVFENGHLVRAPGLGKSYVSLPWRRCSTAKSWS